MRNISCRVEFPIWVRGKVSSGLRHRIGQDRAALAGKWNPRTSLVSNLRAGGVY